MAPKSTSPAQKAANILAWIQRSGTAHSIKDLEKVLPAVASVPSMQVKELLASLVDDDKVRVEKIGSGNWYWSFPSDEKNRRENELGKLADETAGLHKQVKTLRAMIEARESELEPSDNSRDMMSRTDLVAMNDALGAAVKDLKDSLGQFSAVDPEELDAHWRTVTALQEKAATWTDQIQCMEYYIGERCGDREEVMNSLHVQFYGEEVDWECGQLKEWSEDGTWSATR